MTTRRRNGRSPKQIVRKLRDANELLSAEKDLAALMPPQGATEGTFSHPFGRYVGTKAELVERLRRLEEENEQLRELVADLTLDNRMLRSLNEGCW